MARYAKTDVRIWDDEKVKAMTPIPPCGQGLWIRLLVSRHRSAVPGILCVGEAALAEELGWPLKDFREAFREAEEQGLVKADWKARVVWIPKAWKYNRPESPNVVKSWAIPWDETPECDLKREAYRILKALLEGFHKDFLEAFKKACAEPSSKPLANQYPDPEPQHEQEQYSVCPETPEDGRSAPPAEPPLLTYPCDGVADHWDLTQSTLDQFSPLFPTLDLLDQSRQALAWILASPDRRKTAKGMKKFLIGWFGREKNRGGGIRPQPAQQLGIRVGHARAEDFNHSEKTGEVDL